MKYLMLSGVLLSLLLLSSCRQGGGDSPAVGSPLYTPVYAGGFEIREQGDRRILSVKSHTYVIYPRKDSLRYRGKTGYIPWPVQNAVCLSTTHIAYLAALEKDGCITGVSGARYISTPGIREAIASKAVVDVGYEAALNYETLVSLRPDVVFVYGIPGTSNAFLEPLSKLGLQVVYIGDYLETHPLGKAEYLMAFSAFFESEVMENARMQFEDICNQYNSLKEMVPCDAPVKALLNAPFKDSWYIPGGENYMTRLLEDAGALVLGSRKGSSESHIISLEQAYIHALEADYWLHPNAYRSLDALSRNDSRFAQVPAFMAQRVYNNTRRNTPQGGSDFWETGVMEPHIILADLMRIFHPDLLPQHQWVYYEPLER